MISNIGRTIVLLGYVALTVISLKGCNEIRQYWNYDLYTTTDMTSYDYFMIKEHDMNIGYKPYTFVILPDDFDFFTEESQLQ